MHRFSSYFAFISAVLLGLFSCNTTNSLQDDDGNTYKTVKIGNQVWMAENLKVTRFRNGDPIPMIQNNKKWSVTDSAACCMYNNNPTLAKDYGLIYNWFAVNDSRGLAPKGWHIPSNHDFELLLQNLHSDTLAAAILKEPGDEHWLPALIQANGALGFNALPGGYRHMKGSWHNLKSNAYFWTENFSFEMYNWSPRLFSGFADVQREAYYSRYGFSVRCVKDN